MGELIHSMCVSSSKVSKIVKSSVLADVDLLEKEITGYLKELTQLAEQRFVMMKNKQVWYDRENVSIYPKFETGVLESFDTYNQPAKDYKLNFEGFTFLPMTAEECKKSFVRGRGNPYLDENKGEFNYFNVPKYKSVILLREIDSELRSHWMYAEGNDNWYKDDDVVTIVPIFRLNGENSERVTSSIVVRLWIKVECIPEGVSERLEQYMPDLFSLKKYIHANKDTIDFNKELFATDVLNGTFTESIFGYDFNFKAKTERVLHKDEKLTIPPDVLKSDLLNCDKVRADLQPYDEKRLTDINLGHWELFESAREGDIEVELPEGSEFVARPPQMDVLENGTCAIDFGTKSTVAVCRNREARLLRVGKGNLDKAPTAEDYENPTVIELRDVEAFMAAYKARSGRPFTEWEQMTVSHQAAEAIYQTDGDSSVYYSVFGELKQWANAKGKRLLLRDLKDKVIELKPYDELTEEDFDPIELYAYYLGLYINNMHNRIYLDYLLSFPVTYEKDVRERIRKSFERGIRKSLPPALLEDEETMQMFQVTAGASEPAAYAISALEEYGLQPVEVGQSVAYGVFDFGGGTTDFDFGMEEIPEDGRHKFVIHRFGAGGDCYLGGENILDLMAYEVYRDNLEEMRKNHIPFVLPPTCKPFAGAETLVFAPENASQQAYMNSRRLAKEMRHIWERKKGYEAKFSQEMSINLFSTQAQDGSDQKNVKLRVTVDKLEEKIKDRISHGVENFFTSLVHAFDGRKAKPIHIFLAGNSCKSALVRPIFEKFIKEYEGAIAAKIHEKKGQERDTSGTFILHPPLGVKWDEQEQPGKDKKAELPKAEPEKAAPNPPTEAPAAEGQAVPAAATVSLDFDRLRTGKTGVAFGLLRTRIGGRDVKIIDEDHVRDESPFRYYLGSIDRHNHFIVKIGMETSYGEWKRFTFADVPRFELYYTSEPSSMQGKFGEEDVERVLCRFEPSACQDDETVGVYIRKVKPDTIEYAVGREADFSSGEFQGKTYPKRLQEQGV